MAKVSIIIPIYNTEQYLKDCLESVINQTLHDLEIICINDGSTDNSRKILEEYAEKDSRIKIIDKENSGQSSARNIGVKMATGDFIGFIDSDDWIDLNFFEKLYDAAINYNADIACANLVRVYKNKQKYYLKNKRYKCSEKPRLKYEYAKLPDNCYVMNRLYNRTKLQKSNVVFEEGVIFEDIEYSHKIIYYMDKLVTVPDTKYYYRYNPYSSVNIKSDKYNNEYKNAMNKTIKFIQENNIIWSRLKKFHYFKKESYNFLGLPIFKIEYLGDYKKYFVFNSNIFTKKVNIWDKGGNS